MKVVQGFKILCSNDLRHVERHVDGDAWYKAYDALYDAIWNEHIFIWYQIDGALAQIGHREHPEFPDEAS